MRTSKLFKALSLASAVTISSFGIWLTNQEYAFAVNVTPNGWCEHDGARYVIGNFDGKGGKDALCYDRAGSKWINFYSGRKWYTKSSWCTHTGSRIITRNENGDNRIDIVCIDNANHFFKLFAKPDGTFNF